MSKREFEFESIQDSDSIIKYLTSIQEGFQKGSITLGEGEETFVLVPKGKVLFKIRVKQKKKGTKFALKFVWNEIEDLKK